MIRKVTTIALFLCLLTSCTVLENREPCPGLLTVDMRDIRSRMGDGTLRLDIISADGTTVISRLAEVSLADTMRFFIPKTEYSVCSAAGQENTTFSFSGVAYGASGQQSDTVFAFSDRVSVSGEITDFRCTYHKQFATVRIINSFAADAEDPFFGMTLRVSSIYGGLNYRQMTASENEFSCRVKPDREGNYTFRMPRQGDASIILMIESPDITHTVPIGIFLKEMGYDFTAADLQDVTVGVDLVSMNVLITIEDWHREQVFAII